MARHDYTHLSLAERKAIELGIRNGSTKAAIAQTIGKDETTVAKEIRKHRIIRPRDISRFPCICKFRSGCKIREGSCTPSCSSYIPATCKRRDRSPGACNGCPRISPCPLDKYFYSAEQADRVYRETLVDSREGVNLSAKQAAEMEAIIAPLIRQGHSPYVIVRNHPELGISEKTLYNYIEARVFQSILDLDLYKKVKYNKQSKDVPTLKVRKDSSHYNGRTYSDYKAFIESNPSVGIVQMDTVEGVKGGKTLHTIHFVDHHFMIGFICPSKEAIHIQNNIDWLYENLGHDNFTKLFPVCLVDRGSEFTNPRAIECSKNGSRRTNIFYADPQHSWHKAEIESNHRYIRMIIPKGIPLDDLTQNHVFTLFSHINSAPREELRGRTPYACMEFFYTKKILDTLNIQEIPFDDVVLKPYLLKTIK